MNEDLHRLHIIGCGGHARSVADVLLMDRPDTEICFYDDNAGIGETVLDGREVRLLRELPEAMEESLFVAVGDNGKRAGLLERYRERRMISVIAGNADISSTAGIGRAVFVGRLAHIGPEAVIEDNCIINTAAVIEHECVVGRDSHVSVGSRICGRSRIGQRVFVGAGATVIDKIRICDDVIIGAGAVVISDITEPGTYTGVPAVRKSSSR